MAVSNRENILNRLSSILGDRSDDEALGILEDITDTLDDYDGRIKESGDWKAKYEENDKTWRDKYRERFYNSPETQDDYVEEDEVETKKTYTYEDLFKKEG